MSSNLVIITLLSFITWMSLTHAINGSVSNCCLRWSTTKAPLKNIVNYSKQSDSVCAIKAVVFHTKRGLRICSDPESEWAKKATAKVDAAQQPLQMKGNNEEESTTDITPAMPTTSKNAPTTRAKNNGPASSCCVGWSTTKPQLKNIVNYTIQSDSICTIKAIVFHTKRGLRICSDPESEWAKKATAKVDAAQQPLQMKGNNEEESTTDITPAMPTTSKNAPTTRAKNNGPASSCCVGWSTTKPQLKNIVNYTIQSDSICTIKAVVFHTIYGKNICFDPKNGWAKKAIAKVDAARQVLQMKGNNEEGSTTDITPAVPTTSKKTKAPARKARSERKPRKKRLLRKAMRKRKCCC